jgi:hypothetical protein
MPFLSSARGAYGPQGQKVIKGPLAPVWVNFAPGAVGTSAFTYTFLATDDSGDSPTYSLASGALPTGLTLNSTTGVLSGTATVSGTYNYTLRATDVNGRSTDTTSISQVVTLAAPPGGDLYQTAGTYTWVAPTGVTSVNVVAIGGGGSGAVGNGGNAGGGGGLGWKNNISVTPGQSYTVVVGSGAPSRSYAENGNQYAAGTAGGQSYFISSGTVSGSGGSAGQLSSSNTRAPGGSYTGDGGGSGGSGGNDFSGNQAGPGGGGAGGYSGSGGQGGDSGGNIGGGQPGSSGSGGGAGGGGAGGGGTGYGGGGGGGTGVYGQGSAGSGGSSPGQNVSAGGSGGSGGSGGGNGTSAGSNQYDIAGTGGIYGGGGGGTNDGEQVQSRSGGGGRGAVRIIWGGSRSFPSTNVQQNYGVGSISGATNETTRA